MDVAARGAINQTGSFVGNAILRFAATEAGGMQEKVHGIRASNYLAVASLVVGISAGVTMPVVGAVVDHSHHRKLFGGLTALVVTVAAGLQLIMTQDNWFVVWIFEIVGGYALIMHIVCTMAYIPDLTHDIVAMGHYTSRFMIGQYLVQGVFTTTVIAVSLGAKTTNLQTAKFATLLCTLLGVVFLGYSWTFLFKKRPPLRAVPPGGNILTTGFRQLFVTTRMVFQGYPALRWFMVALLFSPEAGAGVVLTIAVTFLTVYVKMDAAEIAIVSLIMLFSNIPGALLSQFMCKKVNPLNSFRMAEILFAVVNALIAITVTGATDRDKHLVYFYAGLFGVAFGWMFPSQRTLAVALIPKGQETEIMGLISFFGQIAGWLPVFIFMAMNEAGLDMRWGLSIMSFFLMASFSITLLCGDYNEAVALVAKSSEDYLASFQGKVQEDQQKGGPAEAAKEKATAGEEEAV